MFIIWRSSILLLLIYCWRWPTEGAGQGERKRWEVADKSDGYDEDYDSLEAVDDNTNDDYDNLAAGRDRQTDVPYDFVGSNLFQDTSEHLCFTPDDVGLLAARADFEKLLPNSSRVKLENDKSVEAMMEYFYGTQEIVRTFSSTQPQFLSLRALSDLVGGYLNYLYVPLVKHSFYAGQLTYKSVRSVYELHSKCKVFLNTNGNGWRNPVTEFGQFNFKIDPINVSVAIEAGPDQQQQQQPPPPCVNLVLSDIDDNDSAGMIVALPKLDQDNDAERLSGIWLPFKRKHNFNLMERSSAFILVRYYVAVIKCYEYQGASPKKFKNLFGKWIGDNVLPFVDDNEFYPGLGAILRIVQTLNTDSPEYADDLVATVPRMRHTEKSTPEYVQIQDQIVRIQNDRDKSNFFDNLLSSSDEAKHKNALLITMLVALGFAVIIACVAIVWTSCYVKKSKRKNTQLFSDGNRKHCPKWYSFFRRPLKRQKQSDGEEFECVPDSPSVISRRKEKSFNRKIDSFDSLSSIGSATLHHKKDYMMQGGGKASRHAQEKLIRSSVLGQRPIQATAAAAAAAAAAKVTKSSSIKSLRQRLKQSKSSHHHHRRGNREHLSISTSSSSSVTVSRAPSFRELNEKSLIVPLTNNVNATTTKNASKKSATITKIPIYRKPATINLCCGTTTPKRLVHKSDELQVTTGKRLPIMSESSKSQAKPNGPATLSSAKKRPMIRCCPVRSRAGSQSSWETLCSGKQ